MAHGPKKFDHTGLSFTSLVVHEVFRGTSRLDASLVADKSTEEAPHDAGTLEFLLRQLKNGLVDCGYAAAVLPDPSQVPPAAQALHQLFVNSGAWQQAELKHVLAVSRDLADSLQAVQEHNSPGGMFGLCRGMLKGRRVIAVMKLESQRGLRLVRDPENHVMTLEVNPDLFVGNKAKLFKGAIFWASPQGLQVMICDEQMENRPGHPAAQYFVKSLLGCTIDDDLAVRTARFFEAVTKAADTVLDDIEDKMDVLEAVRVELKSKSRRTIDPASFLDENFPADKKKAAEAILQRNGVELSRFAKVNAGIDRRYKRTTFRFEDGPSVIAAEGAVKTISGGEALDPQLGGIQVKHEQGLTTMLIRGVVQGMTPRS